MQCERAQEFFSDYLERTLDRPMAVTLEAHLAACRGCREDIEALRDTFFALETVPQVEPPADGAWQVLCRIQAARAEQLEAERARTPGFLAWLRNLSPGSMAMGAGLATLVVAGSVMLSPVGKHIVLGFAPPPPSTVRADEAPTVQVTYGPVSGAQRELNVGIKPGMDLPDARVMISGSQTWEVPPGRINRGTVLMIPLQVAAASPGEVMRVTVESEALRRRHTYWVAAPVAQPKGQTLTLALPHQPLEQALRQLVPYLDQPVVVDGSVAGDVDLLVEEQPARQCLEAVAAQLGARVVEDGDLYRVTRP